MKDSIKELEKAICSAKNEQEFKGSMDKVVNLVQRTIDEIQALGVPEKWKLISGVAEATPFSENGGGCLCSLSKSLTVYKDSQRFTGSSMSWSNEAVASCNRFDAVRGNVPSPAINIENGGFAILEEDYSDTRCSRKVREVHYFSELPQNQEFELELTQALIQEDLQALLKGLERLNCYSWCFSHQEVISPSGYWKGNRFIPDYGTCPYCEEDVARVSEQEIKKYDAVKASYRGTRLYGAFRRAGLCVETAKELGY